MNDNLYVLRCEEITAACLLYPFVMVVNFLFQVASLREVDLNEDQGDISPPVKKFHW